MNFFNTPFHIGRLAVSNRTILAPLAGVSDAPFRRICQEQGAGLTYVEMLSATAICYENKKTLDMMARHASEKILGVQVTGPNAEQIAKAIDILQKKGFETIDINMGCPVRKVVSAGCGSALIKDPNNVANVARAARAITSLPLSIKCRIGYTRDTVNVEQTAHAVASEFVDMFTVHGRTRSESYSTPVDRETLSRGLAAAKKSAGERSIVTVGNGDVFDFESASKTLAMTNCDAVMVSRGALGNPWVFKEILEGTVYQPTFEEWFDVVMKHIDYHEENYGNTRLAAVLLRKHILWYVKGFPGAKHVRDALNGIESLDVARDILKSYFATVPLVTKRYERVPSAEQLSTVNSSSYDPKYEMDRVLDRGVGDEGMEELSQNQQEG